LIWTVAFTADAASDVLTLSLLRNGAGNVIAIQAATLVSIPSPAALPAGLGLIGLALLRRRR
jgi:hypothetical protein